jgi:hypothetical protein
MYILFHWIQIQHADIKCYAELPVLQNFKSTDDWETE